MKTFVTTINCMDGRIQEMVIHYMKKRFDALYVDSITEAGPCKIISVHDVTPEYKNIIHKLNISKELHKSTILSVVGHSDCGGFGDIPDEKQIVAVQASVKKLQLEYPDLEVFGLFVKNNEEIIEL